MERTAPDRPLAPHRHAPDQTRRVRKRVAPTRDGIRCLNHVVRSQRADADLSIFLIHIGELRNPADVDQELRRCEAQLHHGNQAVAARNNLGAAAVLLKEVDGFAQRCCNRVLEIMRNHDAFLPFRIFQTFSERTGISIFVTPNGANASTTAFTTAGVEPIVPASPTPLTPSGFTGDGVTVRSNSNSGKSWARGSA